MTDAETKRRVDEIHAFLFGAHGIEGKVSNLEDVVWKHSRTGAPGLVARVEACEMGARERLWTIRVMFGLIFIQSFLGPEAIPAFLRGFVGL